jgi:hypothetical protein
MKDLLIPSSYQIQVEYNNKYIQQQKYLIDQKKLISENEVLNYKHKDGRIYASDSDRGGDLYLAVSVSPYHPKFEEQVEDGIKDMVFAFLNKNYMTVSSCEGHYKSFNSAQITLAFPVSEDRNIVVEKLKNIPFVNFELLDTTANVESYKDKDGIVKIKRLKIDNHSYEAEAENINKLFFRKYKRYYFLEIRFFKYKYEHVEWPYSYHFFNFLIPLNGLFVNYLKKKYENQVKNMVTNIINSKEFPAYDK